MILNIEGTLHPIDQLNRYTAAEISETEETEGTSIGSILDATVRGRLYHDELNRPHDFEITGPSIKDIEALLKERVTRTMSFKKTIQHLLSGKPIVMGKGGIARLNGENLVDQYGNEYVTDLAHAKPYYKEATFAEAMEHMRKGEVALFGEIEVEINQNKEVQTVEGVQLPMTLEMFDMRWKLK